MELQFEDKPCLERLRELPNALLHVHWDGSLRAEDLLEFYQQKGIPLELPEKDIKGNPIEGDRKIRSVEQLREFQMGLFSKYDIVSVFKVPTMAMQTAEDLKAMAVAHCHYLKSQNTFYAETRFAPWYHAKEGKRGSVLSMDEVISHALDGFAEGYQKTGVLVKPIICINRELDPDHSENDVENAKKIVRAALNYQNSGVVGIDLACFEPGRPAKLFKEAFALTFGSSLNRTVHVDEMGSEEEGIKNIYDALTLLGANGISHARHLYKYPDLIERMVRDDVRLESNPISNITCSFITGIKDIRDLHLDKLAEAGVKVTPNSDDPKMWPNGDLADVLELIRKAHGNKLFETSLRNAIDKAWGLSDKQKKDRNEELTFSLKENGFLQ